MVQLSTVSICWANSPLGGIYTYLLTAQTDLLAEAPQSLLCIFGA